MSECVSGVGWGVVGCATEWRDWSTTARPPAATAARHRCRPAATATAAVAAAATPTATATTTAAATSYIFDVEGPLAVGPCIIVASFALI